MKTSKPGLLDVNALIAQVREILMELAAVEGHLFWGDSFSLLDGGRFDLTGAAPKNVIDLYLAGLALSNQGKLITFDHGIRHEAVIG